MKTAINKKWNYYYDLLETIRMSGMCNMFGAAPYLAEMAEIDEDLAKEVLVNWMHNYDELKKIFNW